VRLLKTVSRFGLRALAVVVMAPIVIAIVLARLAFGILRLSVQAVRFIYRLLLGGFLAFIPRFAAGPTGVFVRVVSFLVQYVVFWAIVWWLQWCVLNDSWSDSATWLVSSRTGLQTALQVLPAVIVAILVLILGSIFVVAQITSQNYGLRSTIVLTLDPHIQQAITRPLALGAAALLLAAQVPDAGDPSTAITAAVATAMLATVVMTARTVVALALVLQTNTAPRAFGQYVVEPIEWELDNGQTGFALFRVGLLGEALKAALRRGDTTGIRGMLDALIAFQDAYLRSLTVRPDIRRHALEGDSYRDNWLAHEITDSLSDCAQEALRLLASEDETNLIAQTLSRIAIDFMKAGEGEDARICVRGLVEMATTAHQVTASGTINFYAAPVSGLANVEGEAEAANDGDTAAYALAGWALGIAYADFHLGQATHSQWAPSIDRYLGPSPPWDAAKAVVQSEEWVRLWANKQYRGPRPVLKKIELAQREHSRRARQGST
jgi:hypothetical protein